MDEKTMDIEDFINRIIGDERAFKEFIERLKNPSTMCVLHDDAVRAAELIELWRGMADGLIWAIENHSGGEAMDSYAWARNHQRKILNIKNGMRGFINDKHSTFGHNHGDVDWQVDC